MRRLLLAVTCLGLMPGPAFAQTLPSNSRLTAAQVQAAITAAAAAGGGVDPQVLQTVQQTAASAQQLATTANALASAALPKAQVGVVGGASPLNSCVVRPSRTYAGAIIGASDLASAANVPNLQATHNTSFYLTSYALTQVAGLSVAAVQSNWAQQAAGIIEVGTDPVVMPDIAAQYGSYVTATNNWTWGGVKGSTWPSLIAAGGWKPTIAALNTFNMGTTNSLSDPYYLMNLAAIADVKAAAPSIKYVLPYLTANAQQVNASLADTDWTLPYWGESRALALASGGIGFDTPANYFNIIREPAYRALTVQQIKWASANGIVSEVLLSPYAYPGVPGTQPQFQYDGNFFQAVQAEITYLHSNGADPTFYVVANYSEGAGTNAPGSDTDPNSETVNAVALWVARNAPTSPMPAALPLALQAEPNALCAPALTGGRSTQRILASDVDGLGLMAGQDPASVIVSGGRINGLAALSTSSGGPVTLGSDGAAPLQVLYDGVGNLNLNSLNGNVTPNLNANVNLRFGSGQTLAFNASGAYPFSMNGDGAGNFNMTNGLPMGNVNLTSNLHITGVQSILLNSLGVHPFSMFSDGVGNTSFTDGLAVGNLNITDNLNLTGSQTLSLNSTGPQPFTMKSSGAGDTYFTDNLTGGNLHLTDNLLTTGTVQSPDFHESGFVVPTTSSSPCITGSFGDGLLGGTAYHFYCYGTNQWSRVALAMGGW